MKCSDCQKLLPQYVENESTLEEKLRIQTHLHSCAKCRTYLRILQTESELITEAIGLERLPHSLAPSILDQLEPYPTQRPPVVAVDTPPAPSRQRRRGVWKQAVIAACAAAVFSITAAALISPAFAAYVSSFITRIGGELGLKRAAEQGFSVPVNQAVTNQGITLRVRDIVADPTRLVISYVLEDEKGELLPNLFVAPHKENRVYLTDRDGNLISGSPTLYQVGEGYADYMFMLKNPPNDLVVHFDIANLIPAAPVQGSWKLDVPVDLTKSIEASSYIPIEPRYSAFHGIEFALEGVTYGPSATRFVLATRVTSEEQERIEEMKRSKGTDGTTENLPYGNYSLQYHIEDETGRIIASQGPKEAPENRHIYFTPGYTSPPERDGDDAWRWYGAFVPSETPEELWFVLDTIEKTEAADFSLSFRPADLPKAPVIKSYDEFASTYTVHQITKGTDPMTNEPVWLITLSAKLKESDFPRWRLYDDEGRAYPVKTDYSTSSVSGNKDGAMLEQTLIVEGLTSLPEELTLSLLTVKRQYTDINWKVAIPPNR